MGENWLGETAIEAGLGYIQHLYLDRCPEIYIARPNFWLGIHYTYEHGTLFGTLEPVKRDLKSMRKTVKYICAPLCHNQHWYMISLSLKDGEFMFAEGKNWCLPQEMLSEAQRVLHEHLDWDTSKWNPRFNRIESPKQTDGNSCGILALSLIESFCSGEPVQYVAKDVISHRIKWLTRCIDLHQEVLSEGRRQRMTMASATDKYIKVLSDALITYDRPIARIMMLQNFLLFKAAPVDQLLGNFQSFLIMVL